MGDLRKRQTWQAGLAELVGTFFLALAALLTPAPSTALAVGLTLAAFVYALGDISGCNVNPAVTLGLVVTRRLSVAVGVLYLAAQLAGAALARLLAPLVAPLPSYAAASPAGEFLGVGFLVLTVLAVSTKFVPKSGSGVAIGAALLAGLLTTRGVLNPAIALAMGLGGTPALWAPLAGALVFGPLALLYLPSGDTTPAPSADNTKPAHARGSGAARPWRPAAKPGFVQRQLELPRIASWKNVTLRRVVASWDILPQRGHNDRRGRPQVSRGDGVPPCPDLWPPQPKRGSRGKPLGPA